MARFFPSFVCFFYPDSLNWRIGAEFWGSDLSMAFGTRWWNGWEGFREGGCDIELTDGVRRGVCINWMAATRVCNQKLWAYMDVPSKF